MKKITLIFGFTLCLILSAVVVLNAGWWVYTVTEPASSSCSTPSYGDELNEGFLGTGYENTWTETGSPDEDATLLGSPPTDCCDEGLEISTSAAEEYSYWDRGSTIPLTTSIDIIAEVYIDSITIDDYDTCIVVVWDDDTDFYSGVGWVELGHTTGTTYYFRGRGNTVGDPIYISTNTWYKIKLHLDGTAANSYIDVDSWSGNSWTDVGQESFTRNDTADGRYLCIGVSNGIGSGESLTYQMGYVYVSTP